MQAVLLCAAGRKTGLGHLTRSDALATALTELDVSAGLVVDLDTDREWLQARSPENDYRVLLWRGDPGRVRSLIASADLVVVDAYGISADVKAALEFRDIGPVVFDDVADYVPSHGILVNGSPGAHLVGYRPSPRVTFLLGTDYQVLRPPFWDPSDRTVRTEVQDVGVMLGGGDQTDKLCYVVDAVRAAVPESATIHVIGVQHLPVTDSRVRPTGFVEASELKQLFDRLDLIVTAAGQTVAEAVSCALPATILKTADNQDINVRGWRETGAVRVSPASDAAGWQGLLKSTVSDSASAAVRRTMVERAGRLDLTGATRRVAKTLRQRARAATGRNQSTSDQHGA